MDMEKKDVGIWPIRKRGLEKGYYVRGFWDGTATLCKTATLISQEFGSMSYEWGEKNPQR